MRSYTAESYIITNDGVKIDVCNTYDEIRQKMKSKSLMIELNKTDLSKSRFMMSKMNIKEIGEY